MFTKCLPWIDNFYNTAYLKVFSDDKFRTVPKIIVSFNFRKSRIYFLISIISSMYLNPGTGKPIKMM